MTAQKVEKVRVEGTVAKVEHVKGSFEGREGDQIQYDFHEVRLLNEQADVNVVRIRKDGPVPVPAKDDRVSYVVDARVAGGNVKMTAESVSPILYADLLPLAAAAV